MNAGVKTTCPYCGVGCGVIAVPNEGGGAAVSGDPSHPANFGRLCSKGLALADTLGLETRVLHPMMRQADGHMARTGWSEALDSVAAGFKRVLERDGPQAIAFYLSGQLLTEDYYVANKLMKGFLGSANVDTNSRLCMASSVAGHKRAFGADVVPGCYEDLDEAGLIVLVGSNAAWCHPILFQRIVRNKRERGAKIVVIDPRRSATAEEADLFLSVAPGMDTVLFSGLLVHLADSQKLDHSFIDDHTTGWDAALLNARTIAPDIEAISRRARLSKDDIARFFDWFANTKRTVTCYSQGVNQSAQGTDKVNAIINCHLATGRIGKPGMGPFSLTGQPNAMGGREVGGLANQLAAHMGFSPGDRDRVARFWNAPNIAGSEGLKAVDMFEAIEQGRIKALWVMGTNPVASLPRGGAMAEALSRLEHFVVSDNVRSNDTIKAGVHILLPAAAWGEKDGTVTNSERRISRQRAFLPLPAEVRPDWWIVSEVARRLGFGASLPYDNAAGIFREHAALSAFENKGTRAFHLSGVIGIDDAEFDALDPFQWPISSRQSKSGGRLETRRLFADGGFFTSDGTARFIPVEAPSLAQPVNSDFPLALNTGRVRDQWHTMTRTGLSPRLSEHCPEPTLEVHPVDGERYGLHDQGFARVSSSHAECIMRVSMSDQQQIGSVFAYIHWNGETAPSARISNLVAPFADPYSGQPEAKATPCKIEPVAFAAEGFCVSRRVIPMPQGTCWARVPIAGGFATVFATHDAPHVFAGMLARSFSAEASKSEYHDEEVGLSGGAAFGEAGLDASFFVARDPLSLPDSCFLKSMLSRNGLTPEERVSLLSGRASGAPSAGGATVCSCFGVRMDTIRSAIEDGCTDVFSIGRATKAGTNCGSCQSELKRITAAVTKDAQNSDAANLPDLAAAE